MSPYEYGFETADLSAEENRSYNRAFLWESLEGRVLSSSDPLPQAVELNQDSGGNGATDGNIASSGSRVLAFAGGPVPGATAIDQMVRASFEQDPISEAHRVASELSQRRAGDRVVFLWATFNATFDNLDPSHAAKFIANGLDVSHDRAWAQTFFSTLKSLGAPLDRVSTDNEADISTWVVLNGTSTGPQIVARMQSIYSNPAAYARLPASVRAFSPEDFAKPWTAVGRSAYIAWNNWSNAVVADAYKQAVVDPIQAAYGPSVMVGNANDITSERPVFDDNGWPQGTVAAPGNVSSPWSYLAGGLLYNNYQKDPRWNRLIASINNVRAVLSDGTTGVTPWVSYPSYTGDYRPLAQSTWVWEQMVRHMVADGVSTFYYFNPDWTTQSDNQFADALFTSLTPGVPTAESLQVIPFDADVIVTGNFRTTYAEFLKYADMPGATNMSTPVLAPPPTATMQLAGNSSSAAMDLTALLPGATGENPTQGFLSGTLVLDHQDSSQTFSHPGSSGSSQTGVGTGGSWSRVQGWPDIYQWSMRRQEREFQVIELLNAAA